MQTLAALILYYIYVIQVHLTVNRILHLEGHCLAHIYQVTGIYIQCL